MRGYGILLRKLAGVFNCSVFGPALPLRGTIDYPRRIGRLVKVIYYPHAIGLYVLLYTRCHECGNPPQSVSPVYCTVTWIGVPTSGHQGSMQFFLLGLACIAAESPSPANQVNESVTLTPRPRCAVLIDRHVAKNAGARAADRR